VSNKDMEKVREFVADELKSFADRGESSGLDVTLVTAVLINSLCKIFVRMAGKDKLLGLIAATLGDMGIETVVGKVVKEDIGLSKNQSSSVH